MKGGKARGKASLLSRHLNPKACFASPPQLRSSCDINGLTVVPDCPKYTDRAASIEFSGAGARVLFAVSIPLDITDVCMC